MNTQEQGFFYFMNADILSSKELTDTDKLLLTLITGLQRKTGWCTASNAYLADGLGKSERTIRRSLERAEELGHLIRETRDNQRFIAVNMNPAKTAGVQRADKNVRVDKNDRGGGQKCPGGADKNVHLNNRRIIIEDNNITPYKSPTGDECEQLDERDANFIQFWELYDKPVDKKKCERKFKKLPLTTQRTILSILPQYVEAHPERQYRKNPYTFLNGENWNDPLPKTAQQKSDDFWADTLKAMQQRNKVNI